MQSVTGENDKEKASSSSTAIIVCPYKSSFPEAAETFSTNVFNANEVLVLESEGEDMENDNGIVPYSSPAQVAPYIDKFHYLESESFTLETLFPHQEVKSSKGVFQAAKLSGNVPVAVIKLSIVQNWSGCSMTTTVFGTDSFNYYYCPFPYCRKKFRKKSNIRAHLTAFHRGPFYCPNSACGKRFNSKVSKLRHVKKSEHDLHCESAQLTDSYHYTQIAQFCLSMCEQMQNAPDFWMI